MTKQLRTQQQARSTKRKRTRIAKKDNNKVYTVNGTEAENLNVNATKAKEKKSLDTLFAEADAADAKQKAETGKEPVAEQPAAEEKPAPKKRGRKSKKELEEIAAREKQQVSDDESEMAAEDAAKTEVEAQVAEEVPVETIPETEEPIDTNKIEELQAKLNQQQQNKDSLTLRDGVWEGDPETAQILLQLSTSLSKMVRLFLLWISSTVQCHRLANPR